MQLDTSTLMMIFFILLFIVSIWKIYAFLPTSTLPDDDTTKESRDELIALILSIIKNSDDKLNLNELFDKVTDSTEFDATHYWRFNHNRLNKLLEQYYIENSGVNSIKDIYNQLNS